MRTGTRWVLALAMTLAGIGLGVAHGQGAYPLPCDPSIVGGLPREATDCQVPAAAASAVLQDARERTAMRELGEQLNRALSSRAVIDQAKGIMMVTHRCTADEAFQLLARLSQQRNIKLHELARTIVDSVSSADAKPSRARGS